MGASHRGRIGLRMSGYPETIHSGIWQSLRILETASLRSQRLAILVAEDNPTKTR